MISSSDQVKNWVKSADGEIVQREDRRGGGLEENEEEHLKLEEEEEAQRRYRIKAILQLFHHVHHPDAVWDDVEDA